MAQTVSTLAACSLCLAWGRLHFSAVLCAFLAAFIIPFTLLNRLFGMFGY